MNVERNLEAVLKASVRDAEGPRLTASHLKSVHRRRVRNRAAVWGIVALLVLTSPISIQAASKWAPVMSFREAVEARLLTPDHAQLPKVEHEHEPNPRVVDPTALGDKNVTLTYLPAGFSEAMYVVDDHQAGVSSTGPNNSFVSLRISDAEVASTAIVDYEWQRPIRHQGNEAVMYVDKRVPEEIRVKWSSQVGTQWRNFELMSRGLSTEEVERVFQGLKWANGR